jgi:pimeloyl-ACP methyl ester carboxylesterase
MARMSVNDIDVYYEEQGSGNEVLIYVQHGGEAKNEMLSLLPAEYHIYIVDLPGYGRSTNLKEFRGFKQWSDDIYTFSRRCNLDKFSYIGYSMTGIVGFQLALDHPEILKSLIPIASIPIPNVPLPGPEEQTALESDNMQKYRSITQRDLLFPTSTADKIRLLRREQARQRFMQDNKSSSKEFLSIMNNQILGTKEGRQGFVTHLAQIRVPTLLLFGAQDWSNPLDQAIVSAMSIPGAKAVFFQDYGHGLSLESPEKVADEISIFIRDLNRNLK